MNVDYLDYKAIGQRIKIARIKKGITQDLVCERLGVSNPHVSNIETGNTKLSLPALVGMANVLSVSADELLCDNINRVKHVFQNEIHDLLEDCKDEEMRVLVEVLKGAKKSIRRNAELSQYE